MKLTPVEKAHLNKMIDSQTFFGMPIEEVTAELLEAIDTEEARVLYIVASMLGLEVRDKQSYDHYPYEAEEYLKKFRLQQ